MKARDLMTSDPFVVTPTEVVSRAAELMRDIRVGCIPVVKDRLSQTLVGLITDRDVTVRCAASGHTPICLVRDHMTAMPLQTVSPDADVSEVEAKMKNAQVRRIPVVKEDGTLVGIIAQADLALKIGLIAPLDVEGVLERISRPEPVTVGR